MCVDWVLVFMIPSWSEEEKVEVEEEGRREDAKHTPRDAK